MEAGQARSAASEARVRQVLRDVGTAGPPAETREFIAALAAAVACAEKLRESVFVLVQKAPTNPASFVATMTDPAVARDLGSLSMLCAGASTTALNSVESISGALARVSPPEVIDELAAGIIRGMVKVVMTCVCKSCSFCEIRRVDPEGAERTITEELSTSLAIVRPEPRIVVPGGRWIG